jgi:hypothetical protein
VHRRFDEVAIHLTTREVTSIGDVVHLYR